MLGRLLLSRIFMWPLTPWHDLPRYGIWESQEVPRDSGHCQRPPWSLGRQLHRCSSVVICLLTTSNLCLENVQSEHLGQTSLFWWTLSWPARPNWVVEAKLHFSHLNLFSGFFGLSLWRSFCLWFSRTRCNMFGQGAPVKHIWTMRTDHLAPMLPWTLESGPKALGEVTGQA